MLINVKKSTGQSRDTGKTLGTQNQDKQNKNTTQYRELNKNEEHETTNNRE